MNLVSNFARKSKSFKESFSLLGCSLDFNYTHLKNVIFYFEIITEITLKHNFKIGLFFNMVYYFQLKNCVSASIYRSLVFFAVLTYVQKNCFCCVPSVSGIFALEIEKMKKQNSYMLIRTDEIGGRRPSLFRPIQTLLFTLKLCMSI